MGRNNAPGSLIIELEAAIDSGRDFWGNVNFQATKIEAADNAPERVIQKIMIRKRQKVELHEDLSQIGSRLAKMESFV